MRVLTLRASVAALAVAACAVLLSAGPAAATIRYKISLDHSAQHLFEVEMDIPQAAPGAQVAMPAWNALYQIRDFAYRLRHVQAFAASPESPLTLTKLDEQTWRIGTPSSSGPPSSNVTISYAIEWNEDGPFNSELDTHHAFINFAELLMYLPDRRAEDTEVTFSQVPPNWRVAVQLSAGPDPNSFVASSYDALVDAPAEVGTFEEFSFSNHQAHFRVVVDSPSWKKDYLEDMLKRITSYEIDLMGGSPFKEYTFFFHIAPDADATGGGMEHSFSTAIASSSTEGAATIAAHEFFHVWNVKRIRPRALEPVDYSKEQPTRALWFAEGVTSTYAAYTLERTGIWSKDQFYSDLAAQIRELAERPARKWQSVEEASYNAWFEKYDDYNQPERSISYYNKGQIDGVLLDLAIRYVTGNEKSLDSVLRRMNAEYAQAGKFYDESDGIRAVIDEVTGAEFLGLFQHYVAGTDEIPYDVFFAYAGLQLSIETDKSPDLGFRFNFPNGGLTVSYVEPASAADQAGLQVGDAILKIEDQDADSNTQLLREAAPGQSVRLHIRRAGAESDISWIVGTREERRYAIVEMPHPTDLQRRIREGLLRGITN